MLSRKVPLKNALEGALRRFVYFVGTHRNQALAWVCLALLLASLARYWVRYDPRDSVPHDPESFCLARNLAETGQFANPFVPLATGPSAHLAPAFPAFLALLVRTFGEGSAGIYAIKLAAVLALSLHLACFPLYSRALGMGELTGVLAALIWIAAGVGIAHSHPPLVMFGWESFYAAILVATAVCCCGYLDSSSNASTLPAWLLGCLLGALALTSSTAGIIFMAWLGWVAWRNISAFKTKSYLIAILLPVVIVAPWIVRNYLVFGRIIPVRDNFGLELAVSNNDCARFGISQNLESGCFARVHPNANLYEASKVLAEGEPAYNQERLRDAKLWIQSHPTQFVKLSALRFAAFWFPPSSGETYSLLGHGRTLERIAVYSMTLLSFAGLLMLYRRDQLNAILCALCLFCYPLLYYFVQYEYRYRYPILWLSFLLGSLPIAALVEKVG